MKKIMILLIPFLLNGCTSNQKISEEEVMNTLLGMFDSFLFAYHDDLDLCWRAALEKIKSYYIPSSIVYHPPEGYTFKWNSFKFYLLERNRQYCLLTHYTRKTYFKMLPALIMVDIGVSFYYLKKGVFLSKLKATLNILKNFGQINSRYYKIQRK